MRGINKVILVGNVGRPAEMRYNPQGRAVATFSLATNRVRGGEGEQEVETEWHRAVAFGRTGEVAAQLLQKGTPVYVEGRMVPRRWKDRDGKDRDRVEIWVDDLQLLGRKPTDPAPVDVESPAADEADIPF